MKFFPDTILLLHIYGFEGYSYSSQYKIDEMVNSHSNSCKNSSNFYANIAKDHLQYLVTPTS